jgi:hypothetical protein
LRTIACRDKKKKKGEGDEAENGDAAEAAEGGSAEEEEAEESDDEVRHCSSGSNDCGSSSKCGSATRGGFECRKGAAAWVVAPKQQERLEPGQPHSALLSYVCCGAFWPFEARQW